uniref:endoribonuclease YbeY-like isoform X4 n=1 Tax=Centroberyx gerrardi TaxID=166262 RepID=UPI003AB00EF3
MGVVLRNLQKVVPLRRARLRKDVVTAHGICHLLGYRHETEEEWTEMLQRESYILNEYNRLTGRQLEPLTKRCSQDR